MPASLTFLGAVGTVTGSRYLLQVDDKRYLVDCGLFQGPSEVEQLNWQELPFSPHQLDAVLLTHAHLDHTGYLPRFIREGFRGPVYATEATCALLEVLLPDSGYLQEEQAQYANKKGFSRHRPALPLYTAQEAIRSLASLRGIKMDRPLVLDKHLRVTMRRSGHILGAAILECVIHAEGRSRTVVFSGDLGRYDQEMMKPPALISSADYVLVESTYGDRLHPATSTDDQLQDAVQDMIRSGGVLVVPSFAVGRTQEVLYHLHKLQGLGRIPTVPIFVDSPMAVDATEVYCRFGDDHNLAVDLLMDSDKCPLRCPDIHFVRSVEESKRLNERPGPAIIISASGMCDGGRVVHHLKRRLPDPRNMVLFVGYQAQGTRGHLLVNGAKMVRIHGEETPVRARIKAIESLSAHGDKEDLLRWLAGFTKAPRRTFVVHGEPGARDAFSGDITKRFGWDVALPKYLEKVELG